MDSEISEIIKDLSEATLAITSTICLIIKMKSKKRPKKSKRKK